MGCTDLCYASGKDRKRKAVRVKYKGDVLKYIQCVSVDSTSLIIYPEIKATKVAFQSLK